MMQIQGAYVQAWVWVGLDEPVEATQGDTAELEEKLRTMAVAKWSEAGELEIDDGAPVSLSKVHG